MKKAVGKFNANENPLRHLIGRILYYLVIALFSFYIVFPFFWQIITSLKPESEIFLSPPRWFPGKISFESFVNVFLRHNFQAYLTNSVLVGLGTTILAVVVSSVASYALARLRFKGKKLVLGVALAASMFPAMAIICPLFVVLRSLSLLNTLFGLIIVYSTFALPMALWNQTSFFRQIPYELEEAAMVDGCSPLTAFTRIILPLAGPGTFTTAILVFIGAWNEFTFSLVFNTKDAVRTVPVGIAMFPGLHNYPWGDISAASVIVTFPMIILVLICQRWIVSGLTAGAVKG